MEKFVDYYKLLGIKKNATDSEIRKAYRAALKKYHPDKNIDKSAEELVVTNSKFLLVCKAEETLSNPKLRRIYDSKYDEYQRKLSFTNVYTDDQQKVSSTEDYSSVWKNLSKSNPTPTKKEQEPASSKPKEFEFTEINEEKLRAISQRRHNKKTKKATDLKSGVLNISEKFLRELAKLKIRPKDNYQRYVLRNKKNIVASSLIAAVVVGGIVIKDSKDTKKEIAYAYPTATYEQEVQTTIPEPTETTEEATMPTEDESIITLYRVHTVVPGDTLSQLSIDSNTTQEEIKRVNAMSSNTVVLGTNIIIPYIINAEDLSFYTKTATYSLGASIDEYAKEYETNVETITKLNKEAITYNGTQYEVITDSLVVPNFITKSDYNILKAADAIKQKTISNNQ